MKLAPDSYESEQTILVGLGMAAVTLLVIGSGVLLVCFSILRENKVFWTNAGGYPIFLRDLVFWTYWPLLLGTIGVLSGLSAACFSKIGGGLRFFVMESILILLAWGLVALASVIALGDNVADLLRPGPSHHQR